MSMTVHPDRGFQHKYGYLGRTDAVSAEGDSKDPRKLHRCW
jgi:hypothetical protein